MDMLTRPEAGPHGLPDEPRTVVRPKDTELALRNPCMGWVLFVYNDGSLERYGGRLEPCDTLDDFPGLTVAYLRVPWSWVEPEEGRFNWALLDSAAQRYVQEGLQIALRFTASETTTDGTPDWVRAAGAHGRRYTPGAGIRSDGRRWEPDFDDPVFLERLDRFLAAAAARYDGNPEVAFVDVGAFGVWGEGHTYGTTELPYSSNTAIRHIDLHRKHFKRTLLVLNDDYADAGRGMGAIDYGAQRGLTLRDDSILCEGGERAYFSAPMAARFWPTVPVILEPAHFGTPKERGPWGDGGRYLDAVEDYHASYAGAHWWPREFLAKNEELVRRINLRLGYRLQLTEMSWPKRISPDTWLYLRATWRNGGVAPCYPGGHPALTLKDERGGIVGVFADERFDVRALPVGAPGEADTITEHALFTVPTNSRPGQYDMFVSVGTRTGSPRIALPLSGDDGHRRYRLGSVEVGLAPEGQRLSFPEWGW